MTTPELETRAFAVIADGSELLQRPALLAAFAEVFGPESDATLVVASADVAALSESFAQIAAAVGLADETMPDVLAVPIAGLESASPVLARAVHAVLSERVVDGPLALLPRCGVADGPRMRELATARDAVVRVRSALPPRLALPEGYESRAVPEYFDDPGREDDGIVHQPDVYAVAAHLARTTECTHIVDVGCGAAEKLLPLAPEFHLIGVDYGANIEYCRRVHPEQTWLTWDIELEPVPALPASVLDRAVVICADVIEHLVDPATLIAGLGVLAERAQAVVLSTPDRVRVRGAEHAGPPPNAAHVREWALEELAEMLAAGGLGPAFAGHTINNDRDRQKRTSVVIADRRRGAAIEPAPDDLLVTAVLPAYNEADIIEQSVRRLVEQGVQVRVVDNWSTDDTVDRVDALGLGDMVTVERFPADGPSETYDWSAILRNTERIAAEIGRGWIIHQDVDEVRESPWPGVGLRDALHHVSRCGFNAVDHTVIDFRPVDGEDVTGDVVRDMRHFEFGRRPGHFLQIKAWQIGAEPVDLAGSGGHEAAFAGRRVFPYKFLSRHYPVRSQEHGERKVFADRVPRWNAEERAQGWHHHYDALPADHRFLHDAAGLLVHDESFGTEYVLERLTGVGILRD